MSKRPFRTPESYHAERVTRDMIEGFLLERGFTEISDARKFHGKVESQIVNATTPEGRRTKIRVRLCWRRRNSTETYSAAQILPKIKNNDWEGTLEHKFHGEANQGITHSLFIQRELETEFSYAALIPQSAILSIWCGQRDVSKSLIDTGKMGRRTKNHAMNGSSPTIWLYDEKAPEVIAVLWEHPAVIDLMKIEVIEPTQYEIQNDSYDDLSGVDPSLLGRDEAQKVKRPRSYVPRDPAVRKEVIIRSKGRCERSGCGVGKNYSGFLDVHHILGVEKSDRVWNCVALCPNCHREAHFSPEQDEINARLLQYAKNFESLK